MLKSTELGATRESILISIYIFSYLQNEIQVGKIERNTLWYHVDCFEKVRWTLTSSSSGDNLQGIEALNKNDQIEVKNILSAMKL